MAMVSIILGLAYPLIVYLAMQRFEPRSIALVGLALLALRTAIVSRQRLLGYARALGGPVAAVGATLGLAALFNHPVALLLTPAGVSFALLASFARTLWTPMSQIERFARVV